MFGLGAREAVLAALHAVDARGFGAPCSAVELVEQLRPLAGPSVVRRAAPALVTVRPAGTAWERGAASARLLAAAFALGWHRDEDAAGTDAMVRFRPGTP
jgi:hypothetical protein